MMMTPTQPNNEPEILEDEAPLRHRNEMTEDGEIIGDDNDLDEDIIDPEDKEAEV